MIWLETRRKVFWGKLRYMQGVEWAQKGTTTGAKALGIRGSVVYLKKNQQAAVWLGC